MGILDTAILLAYLLTLAVIAWLCRRTGRAHDDFFLANRSLGALPVGLSVMVTSFSAVNYVAFPGEVCAYGLYVLASLPAFFLAAYPVIRYWLPYFQRLRPVSVYAFLEERFDLRVRLLAGVVFLLWRVFWMSAAFYASCKILSILTGVPYVWLLLGCGVVTVLYTSIGGMKAVVWTDVMQFCVLFGSIAAGTALVLRGGDFWGMVHAGGRLKPFSPIDWAYLSPDPRERMTLWSALVGSSVMFLTRFGADQMVMQRYFSAKSLVAVRRGLWLNGVAATVSLSLLALFGLALHAFMAQEGLVGRPPVVGLSALLKTLPAGMTGLTLAGLLAATMSSIDSGLNSCAATLAVDFQERLGLRRLPPFMLTCLLSVLVLVFAGYVFPELNKSQTLFVIINKTVNVMGTPLLAVMVCAMFLKRIGAWSAFWGTLGGIVLTALVCCCVPKLSLHYYAVASLVMTLGCILACHVIRGGRDGQMSRI